MTTRTIGISQLRRMFLVLGCVAVATVTLPAHAISIERFGAVAGDTSYATSVKNGKALFLTFQAAARNDADRSVVVPAGKVYSMVPYLPVVGVDNVTMWLEGTLNAFPGDQTLWPNHTSNGRARCLLEFFGCSDVSLLGNGTLQGNGYRWWVSVFKTGLDNRPHLLRMESCIRTLFRGWTLLNSPMYHVKWVDMLHALVEDVTVHVDVFAQQELLRAHGHLFEPMKAGSKSGFKSIDAWPVEYRDMFREAALAATALNGVLTPAELANWSWPTFPLNTDGIDVRGHNITVRRCDITNFDDSLCVKPMNGNGNLTQCSQDILFEDSHITWGVGSSVGSVGPNPAVSCIRNTTFRNIRFTHPLKAIYVKPNPGDEGSGIVDRITYENIHVEDCPWWTVWVSTQQQHQPGSGADTGCSWFYPLPGTKCQTQPLVPVTHLTIRNLTAIKSWLSPGVLMCNAYGPGTNWLMEDINIDSVLKFPMGDHFLCEALVNATWSNVNVNCTDHIFANPSLKRGKRPLPPRTRRGH